ncbi:MAG: NADH-quinone oxidoreductase subunit C [Dehalococcoidales bacterium]|nr:MAG: NADH-quinone oxidoreductase subunit C [Dehalococcoidales bacterium]
MTVALSGKEIAAKLEQQFASDITESNDRFILVKKEVIPDIIALLKTNSDLDFNFLNYITAVDYLDYFEVIYQLTSMRHNHSIVIKTRCFSRENPSVPSIVDLYSTANVQEREIYDLMGIRFEGHPNMTRMFLWEGFEGYPQRKDYL